MTIRNIVDLYRKEHHTTYAAIAKRLGMSPRNFHKMVTTDDGMNMTFSNVLKIIDHFNMEVVFEGSVCGYEDPAIDGVDDCYLLED